MRLSTQVILTSISKSIKHVGVFVLSLFLTRLFTKDEYGTYLQIMLISNTVLYLALFGLPSSIYYFLPRSGHKKRMMKNTISIMFLIAIVVSFCIYMSVDLFAERFTNPALSDFSWLIAAFVLFQMPIKLYEPFMVSTKNVPRFVILNGGFNLGFLLVILIPLLLGWPLYDLMIALLYFFAAQFLSMYAMMFFTYRSLEDDPEGEEYQLKEQIGYSLPIGFSGAIAQVGIAIDKIIVSSYFNPATLAVYSRGAIEIPMLNVIANSLGNILMPKFVEEYRAGNKKAVVKLWHSSIRMMAMFIYPMLVYFIITADRLIPFLFTEEYIGSVIIFQVYTLGLLTRITSYDSIVRTVGKTGILLKMTSFAVVLNITFTIGLIEMIGLVGAPLATIIVSAIIRFSYLVVITKLLDISLAQVFPWSSLIRLLASSLFSAIVIWPLLMLDLTHFQMLALTAPIFGIAYLIAFRFSGALNNSEKKSVRGLLPKKLRWVI